MWEAVAELTATGMTSTDNADKGLGESLGTLPPGLPIFPAAACLTFGVHYTVSCHRHRSFRQS